MADRKRFAASLGEGCAVQFMILLLFIVLVALLLTPESGQTVSPTPSDGSSPDTQGTSLATSTPIPARGVASYNCQTGIGVGQTIDVVHDAVRMRHSPGYVDKDDDQDTKHYLETGDRVVVKNGPEIVDGLCWWFIEHEGFQGWTANHSRSGILLLSP